MKNHLADLLNLACVSLSLATGLLCSHWAAAWQDVSVDIVASANDQSKPTAAVRYVQEPAQRTSLRPDSRPLMFDAFQRDSRLMLSAFSEATRDCTYCTARFSVEGQQVALGAIVGEEGWLATKASLLPEEGEIVCTLFDQSKYVCKVVSRVENLDLALVRIAADKLPVIPWDSDLPARGRWLATTSLNRTPTAVGVSSAPTQAVATARAVLGVYVDDAPDGGAAVTKIIPGTGAAQAGLKIDDKILRLNGVDIGSRKQFMTNIAGGLGGQTVRMVVKRGDQSFRVNAKLMDLTDEMLDEANEVSGSVSHRATGFEQVIVHDTVLTPNQCGGPIVNLDGKAVGLNIARAGRVSSYALPTAVVQPVVESLIRKATLVSDAGKPTVELEPVR